MTLPSESLLDILFFKIDLRLFPPSWKVVETINLINNFIIKTQRFKYSLLCGRVYNSRAVASQSTTKDSDITIEEISLPPAKQMYFVSRIIVDFYIGNSLLSSIKYQRPASLLLNICVNSSVSV